MSLEAIASGEYKEPEEMDDLDLFDSITMNLHCAEDIINLYAAAWGSDNIIEHELKPDLLDDAGLMVKSARELAVIYYKRKITNTDKESVGE